MLHNENIAVPKVEFDTDGSLLIWPADTSSKDDFDFYVGKWQLLNRKLKKRLSDCNEWEEFTSTQEMYKILNGLGNIDNFLANFNGEPFEGMTVRLFNPLTKLWTLYWADSNQAILQPGVTGSFLDKVAHFFTADIFEGRPILVVFRWDARDALHPVWSQAFSADDGNTWEWNWYMYFSKFSGV